MFLDIEVRFVLLGKLSRHNPYEIFYRVMMGSLHSPVLFVPFWLFDSFWTPLIPVSYWIVLHLRTQSRILSFSYNHSFWLLWVYPRHQTIIITCLRLKKQNYIHRTNIFYNCNPLRLTYNVSLRDMIAL